MPKLPAPLDCARIKAALIGTRFADVRCLAETTSTNADARAMLGDPSARGATLVADFQTGGVGRKGRAWIAPPGSSLLFTTILPDAIATPSLWAVPFWIALGVAEGVERAAGVRLDLVWPNDLFAKGGKTGGILSVARVVGNEAWIGCGVGLDVRRPAGDAALDALQPQPVFLDELAPAVEREAVLAAILQSFDASYALLDDPERIARAWERGAGLPGTTYRYRRDADGAEGGGVALRLGSQGTLLLRTPAGEESIDMADVRVTGRAS